MAAVFDFDLAFTFDAAFLAPELTFLRADDAVFLAAVVVFLAVEVFFFRPVDVAFFAAAVTFLRAEEALPVDLRAEEVFLAVRRPLLWSPESSSESPISFFATPTAAGIATPSAVPATIF